MKHLAAVALLLCVSLAAFGAASLNETRKKAESGIALEQFLLGISYAYGNGVPKDSAEALMWYRKSAEQGFAMAQSSLGVMYENGTGVTKDSAEAEKWYRRAAAQGDVSGQFNLGLMYANGAGVPLDLIQAHMWLNLVGATGDETYTTPAKTYLARVEKKMTAEQIAEATKLAREMFERKSGERLAVAPAIFAQGKFGTQNIGPTAVDARWINYGAYLQRMIESVQLQWEHLPRESRVNPTTGSSVSVKFVMDSKGLIARIVNVDSTAKDAAERACMSSITDRAPYGEWTDDMKAVLGEQQEMTFTFYYR